MLTPKECVALARSLGRDDTLTFRPLAGGLGPQLAWQTLDLFEARVLPFIDVTKPVSSR